MSVAEIHDLLLEATGRFLSETGASPFWGGVGRFAGARDALESYLATLAAAIHRAWPTALLNSLLDEASRCEADARARERERLRRALHEAGAALAREGRALPVGEVLARLLGALPD
jgi:hypothetical protein